MNIENKSNLVLEENKYLYECACGTLFVIDKGRLADNEKCAYENTVSFLSSRLKHTENTYKKKMSSINAKLNSVSGKVSLYNSLIYTIEKYFIDVLESLKKGDTSNIKYE